MQTRIAAILLVASATCQAFFCIMIALLIPGFFVAIFKTNSPDQPLPPDWYQHMVPMITRLVSDHPWLIAVAFAIVCLSTLIALRLRPQKVVRILAIGLSAQGLATWLAMFSFCYVAFLGDMSFHRRPKFDDDQFLRFGGGVFPLTFLLIVAPMIAALWRKDASTSSN